MDTEKLTSKEKLKLVGRWIAVIPAAILAYLVGGMLANFFFLVQGWLIGVSPESFWGQVNFYIISSIVSSVTAVFYGSRVAPSHRKIVSMVLATLIIIFLTVAVIVELMYPEHVLWTIASAVASIIAAGVVVHGYFEKGDSFGD